MVNGRCSPEYFKGPNLRIGVIGCGYVGLPLILRFAERGHFVWGFDIDPAKVEQLNAGQSYLRHVPAEEIKRFVDCQHFVATDDFSKLQAVDAILICVPTPLDERREPDLSYVEQTAHIVGQNLQRGQLVVLESTTYPGTTEELVLPILEVSGLRCPTAGGEESKDTTGDFYLAFSPEREDPGNKKYSVGSIPKVIGGVNSASRRAAEELYSQIVPKIVSVSSTRAAEMTKLLENIFRCVNIALVNELKMLCLRMGLDIWEVIDAASTKPFGFMPFYPGPGLGGHCIPLDPYYLSWKAREFDFATRFIELAGEINTNMPYLVVEAVSGALNRCEKSLKGSRVLILGVAYKKDVDDTRESPALKIMHVLLKRGARVTYNDPYTPALHKMRHYDFSSMRSLPLTAENLSQHDCVVIVTDHSVYDYQMIVEHAQLVVDTRNATGNVSNNREKIILC
jgi:UDP-N-acetyl-D-glucosamine dehydrogenase